MVALCVVLWEEEGERACLLRDPMTGRAAAFDTELAVGLAGYVVRRGALAAGVVAPPSDAVPVLSALDAVAMADAVVARAVPV